MATRSAGLAGLRPLEGVGQLAHVIDLALELERRAAGLDLHDPGHPEALDLERVDLGERHDAEDLLDLLDLAAEADADRHRHEARGGHRDRPGVADLDSG